MLRSGSPKDNRRDDDDDNDDDAAAEEAPAVDCGGMGGRERINTRGQTKVAISVQRCRGDMDPLRLKCSLYGK